MHFGIIAAGEGSRLAREGVETPKPLLPINGVPMIERLIRIFEDCGAESVSVVTNSFMPGVKEFLESFRVRNGDKLNLEIRNTPSSMHTFYELSKLMKGRGRFIATTVDTIFREEDFRKYVDAYQKETHADGMMAVTDFIEDEKPLYVDVDSSMNITGFLDKPSDDSKYVSGGIYGLGEKGVKVLDKCMASGVERMRNYQRALLAEGLKLKAFPMGKIIDVDHAGDLQRAEEFLR